MCQCTPSPASGIPFDPQRPYRLTEEDDSKLCRVRGTLTVLADLTGYAHKGVGVDISPLALLDMLWLLQTQINDVITSYQLDVYERKQA